MGRAFQRGAWRGEVHLNTRTQTHTPPAHEHLSLAKYTCAVYFALTDKPGFVFYLGGVTTDHIAAATLLSDRRKHGNMCKCLMLRVVFSQEAGARGRGSAVGGGEGYDTPRDSQDVLE